MIRLICRRAGLPNFGPGATPSVVHKTYDIECPELEAALRSLEQVEVVGLEVLEREESV